MDDRRRGAPAARFGRAMERCGAGRRPGRRLLRARAGPDPQLEPTGMTEISIRPGIVSIMALSYVYAAFGSVPAVAALFFGLKAAVLAIVLQAVHRVGSRALKSRSMVVLAALAFVGIFFLGVPFPLIVLAAAIVG